MIESDLIIVSSGDEDVEEEGIASVVARSSVKFKRKNSEEIFDELCAIKIADANRKGSREPHDIVKEIRLLMSFSHHNIVPYYSSYLEHGLQEWKLFMPWIPLRLEEILNSPEFTPNDFPKGTSHLILSKHSSSETRKEAFIIVAKSLIYQLISAVDYLHNLAISHRDVKPGNILLKSSGCVQLIDFGIAWETLRPSSAAGDLWPESRSKMCCDVGTGPYRAPELLYGPKTYDPFAIDMWSLGTTVSQFFTPVCLINEDSDVEGDVSPSGFRDSNDVVNGMILPPDLSSMTLRSAKWIRSSLFNSEIGDLGLLWSIYSTRGTPNENIWPTFKELPDTDTVQFRDVPPVELLKVLPNLPPGTESTGSTHAPPDMSSPSPLDFIHRLLVYLPHSRLKTSEALNHAWFKAGTPLLLPTGYEYTGSLASERLWTSHDLGFWVNSMIRR